MNKKSDYSFGLIQIPVIVGLVLMAMAIPVTMKLSQKSQDNRNLAAEKKCSVGEEECQGGGTGYLCKCLEYCPGCGTYWRCSTYEPGRCLPPAPTPPPENYGCKGDKVNFTCVGKQPGDRCEGYPGTCLMTPGQEARGCICKPDDLSVLTPTVKPITTPGTTVNSTSCFFGVSSCASINRYSKSGCCPAGAPASCCGDLIPNSAKVCQKETYECSGGKLRMCKSDGLGYTDWVTCASGSCQNSTSCTPVNSNKPTPTQVEDKTLTACISGCDKDFAGKPDELKKCEDSCRNFVLAEPTKRLVPTATPIAHSLGECEGTNNNPFCVGLKDGDRCKGFAGTCRLFSGSIDKGCSCIEDTIPGIVASITPKITTKPNGASCAGGTLDGQAACLNKNDCRVCKNGLYEKAANLEPCVGTGGVCDPYYGVQADQRNEINKFLGKTEEEIKREMCSGVASYLMASCMKAADTSKVLANLPQTAKERAVEEKIQLQVMSLSSNGDKTALINRCQQMETDKNKCTNMSVEDLVKNYLPIYQNKAGEIAANYSKNNQQYKNETELANLLLSGNKEALVKKCRDENFDDSTAKNKCGSISIDQLVKEYLPFYKDQATALASEYSRIKDQAPVAQAVASGDKALLIKKCREATGGTGQCEKKSVSELIVLYLPAYQGQATQIAKQYEQVLTQQPVAEALVKGDKTKLIDLCKKQNPSRNCEKESLETLVKDYLPIYEANSSQLVNGFKQVEMANKYLTNSDDKFVNDGCATTQGAGTMAALKCIEYNKKPEDILKQTGMDEKTVTALVTQKKVSEVVMKYQYGQTDEDELINQCKLLKGKNCADNQSALGSILALTNNPNLTIANVEEQKQKIAQENEAYRKVAGTLANLNTLESVTEQVSSGKMTWTEVKQNLDEQAKDPSKWLVMNWNNVTGGRFKRGNDMVVANMDESKNKKIGDLTINTTILNPFSINADYMKGVLVQGGDAAAVATVIAAAPLAPVAGLGMGGFLGTGLGIAMVPQMSGMAVDTCELAKQGKATQADCNSAIALAGISVAGAATGLLSQAANLTKVATTAEALGTATKIGTATRAVGTVMNASKAASTALKVVEISSDVVGAVTFGDMAARTCDEYFKAQAEGRESEATGLDCASTTAMALASGGKLMGAVGGQIAKNSLNAEQALKAEQGIQKGMTALHTVSADLFAASACSRVAGDLITNKGENTNLDTVSMCAMGLSGAVQTHNLIKPIEVKPIASSNNPVKPIDPTNLITNGLKWNGAEKRWENVAGQKVENLVPENKYVYDQRVNNWREVSSGKFVSEAVVLGEQALIMTNKSNLFWNMEKKVWVDESGKEVVHVVENYAYEEGKWKEVKTGQVVDEGVVRSAQINRLRELNEVVIGREIGVVEARLEKAKQETLAAYEAEKGLPVEQRVKHAEALKKYLALEAELKSLQAVKAENGVNNQEAAQRIAQAKEQEVIRQSDEVVKKQAEVNKIQEQIDAIVKENNLEKIDRRTSEGKKIAELEKQQAAIREEIEVIVAKGKQEAVAPVEPVAEAKKNIFEQIKEKVAPKKEVVEVVAVDQVSKLTTEAKEKAAKDAEVYEYDNRQKLIDQEKEILAKTESELARLTEGTETYLQKKAEVEASQVIIERLENLVEPANAAEIRQGRVAVRFGEWGKEIPKAEERIAILEKKEAELTRAANSRSENRTWWERLTGKSEIEVRVEFYKRQNELFKVKKQLALERSLAVRESELIKATDPIQIELLKGEIDRLMNLEEVRVRTGNESLDLTYEYLIREHETRMQKDGMAGNNNVFSIDSNQTLAFLKAMSTPDILLEFALAGGKTTVIGPLIMKANNLLYGRTGEFIAAEGQSSQAYKDMVRAMSKDIKIPNNVTAEEVAVIDRIEVGTLETVAKSLENKKYVAIESGAAKELERIIGDKNSTADQVRLAKEINKKISQGGVVIRDVVLVSSIGNDVIALRDRVKNASHVVTEASVPGFLETMVLNGSGTPEQLRAAREVLTKLRKDVAVFVDEAHLNFDPNKVFVQGNGEGKPISEGTKKNVEWLAGELTNLGIIKKGEMVDLSVTDINGRRLIEIKEGVSGFSRAGREVIAEKLAERLGVSKEIIIETFENGGRAKGTTEEVVRVLEVMNEYGRQLSMKKGSDFGLRENTESGKKQNAVIAKDGVAQLEMQYGNEVTAAVFETIVSTVSGVEPNLGAINLTGKSAKAAFADHVAAIRADGNSSLAAGTGTIGRNRGTLESVYKLAVSESDLILEKFLGKRGDQGLIKESNILGVGRNEGTPDSFNTVLNRTIDQAVRIRDGAIGNRGNLEVVLGGKDIAPDVWVKRAAENREFINGSEHEFIYRNENGVWKQVKVDASGKIISTTEVSYEYAKGVLNNPKTKNTTVVIGEGGATGTNVLAENTVPGIDIISTQTGRDQLDQSAARIGRIKGSKQETFMLVIGAEENRIVTKTELRNIVNEVQVKLNQQNTYQAVSAAIEIAGTKVLKEIILNGEEGSVGVRVAREALAELQNAEGGRNLEVNQTSESPIEALQRQTAKIREIYLEISKTGKYKELFEYLEKNNPEMLAKVENNTKEIKLEFATETKAVAEGVLSSRDLVELAENFGKTITKDLLPEKISRAGKNAEEVIAEIMEQIKKEPAEVGMAEGQAERQVVAEEKISPAAKYAFENRATRLGIEGYKPGVETWGQFVNRVNVAAEERRKNPVEKQENNPVVVGNAAMMIQNKISEYKKQIEALGGVVEENASFNQLREKADQLIVTLERKASVKRNNNESVEDFKKRVDNILAQREADKKALIEEIRGVFKKYGIDLSPDGKPITEVRELDKIAQDLGDNLPKFEKGEKWPTYLARVKQKQQDLIALNKAKDEARKEFVQITLEENSELEKISEIGELNSWKEKVRARVAVLPNQKVVEENEVVAEKINPNQLTIEDARKALAVIRDKGKRLIVIFEKQVEGLTTEEKTALENVEREDQLTEIEAKRQQRIIDDRERLNQEAISLGTKRLNGESDQKLRVRLDGIKAEYQQYGRLENENYFAFKARIKAEKTKAEAEARAKAKAEAKAKADAEARVKAEAEAKAAAETEALDKEARELGTLRKLGENNEALRKRLDQMIEINNFVKGVLAKLVGLIKGDEKARLEKAESVEEVKKVESEIEQRISNETIADNLRKAEVSAVRNKAQEIIEKYGEWVDDENKSKLGNAATAEECDRIEQEIKGIVEQYRAFLISGLIYRKNTINFEEREKLKEAISKKELERIAVEIENRNNKELQEKKQKEEREKQEKEELERKKKLAEAKKSILLTLKREGITITEEENKLISESKTEAEVTYQANKVRERHDNERRAKEAEAKKKAEEIIATYGDWLTWIDKETLNSAKSSKDYERIENKVKGLVEEYRNNLINKLKAKGYTITSEEDSEIRNTISKSKLDEIARRIEERNTQEKKNSGSDVELQKIEQQIAELTKKRDEKQKYFDTEHARLDTILEEFNKLKNRLSRFNRGVLNDSYYSYESLRVMSLQILGLSIYENDLKIIRARFFELSKFFHADTATNQKDRGLDEAFVAINEAYTFLSSKRQDIESRYGRPSVDGSIVIERRALSGVLGIANSINKNKNYFDLGNLYYELSEVVEEIKQFDSELKVLERKRDEIKRKMGQPINEVKPTEEENAIASFIKRVGEDSKRVRAIIGILGFENVSEWDDAYRIMAEIEKTKRIEFNESNNVDNQLRKWIRSQLLEKKLSLDNQKIDKLVGILIENLRDKVVVKVNQRRVEDEEILSDVEEGFKALALLKLRKATLENFKKINIIVTEEERMSLERTRNSEEVINWTKSVYERVRKEKEVETARVVLNNRKEKFLKDYDEHLTTEDRVKLSLINNIDDLKKFEDEIFERIEKKAEEKRQEELRKYNEELKQKANVENTRTRELDELGASLGIGRMYSGQPNDEYEARIKAISEYFKNNADLTEEEKAEILRIGNPVTIKIFDEVRNQKKASELKLKQKIEEFKKEYEGRLTELEEELLDTIVSENGLEAIKTRVIARIDLEKQQVSREVDESLRQAEEEKRIEGILEEYRKKFEELDLTDEEKEEVRKAGTIEGIELVVSKAKKRINEENRLKREAEATQKAQDIIRNQLNQTKESIRKGYKLTLNEEDRLSRAKTTEDLNKLIAEINARISREKLEELNRQKESLTPELLTAEEVNNIARDGRKRLVEIESELNNTNDIYKRDELLTEKGGLEIAIIYEYAKVAIRHGASAVDTKKWRTVEDAEKFLNGMVNDQKLKEVKKRVEEIKEKYGEWLTEDVRKILEELTTIEECDKFERATNEMIRKTQLIFVRGFTDQGYDITSEEKEKIMNTFSLKEILRIDSEIKKRLETEKRPQFEISKEQIEIARGKGQEIIMKYGEWLTAAQKDTLNNVEDINECLEIEIKMQSEVSGYRNELLKGLVENGNSVTSEENREIRNTISKSKLDEISRRIKERNIKEKQILEIKNRILMSLANDGIEVTPEEMDKLQQVTTDFGISGWEDMVRERSAKEKESKEKQIRIETKKIAMTDFIREAGESTARVGGIIREFGFNNVANWSRIYQMVREIETVNDMDLADIRSGKTTKEKLIKNRLSNKKISIEEIDEKLLINYLSNIIETKYKEYLDYLEFLSKVKTDKGSNWLPLAMRIRIIVGDGYSEIFDQFFDIYQKADFENIDANDLDKSIAEWLEKRLKTSSEITSQQKLDLIKSAKSIFIKRFEEIVLQPITFDRLTKDQDGFYRDKLTGKKYIRVEGDERLGVLNQISLLMGIPTSQGYLLKEGYFYEAKEGLANYEKPVEADYLAIVALLALTQNDFELKVNTNGDVSLIIKSLTTGLNDISLRSIPEIDNLRNNVVNFKDISDAQIAESLKKLNSILTVERINELTKDEKIRNILLSRKLILEEIKTAKTSKKAVELIRQISYENYLVEVERKVTNEDERESLKRRRDVLEEEKNEIEKKLKRKETIKEAYSEVGRMIDNFGLDGLKTRLNNIYNQLDTNDYATKANALAALEEEEKKMLALIDQLNWQSNKLGEYWEADELRNEINTIVNILNTNIERSQQIRNQMEKDLNDRSANIRNNVNEIINAMYVWRGRVSLEWGDDMNGYNVFRFGSFYRNINDYEKENILSTILLFWENDIDKIKNLQNLENVSRWDLEGWIENIDKQIYFIRENSVFFKNGTDEELITYLLRAKQDIEVFLETVNKSSGELLTTINEIRQTKDVLEIVNDQINYLRNSVNQLEDDLRIVNQQIEELDADLSRELEVEAEAEETVKAQPFNRKSLVVGNNQVVDQVIHFYDKRAKTGKVVMSMKIDEEVMNKSLEEARNNGATEGDISFVSSTIGDDQVIKLTDALVYEEDGVVIKLSLASNGGNEIRSAIGLINIEIDKDRLTSIKSEDLLKLIIKIMKEKFGIDNLFEDTDSDSELEAKRKILGVQNKRKYEANDPELNSYQLRNVYEDFNTYWNSSRAESEANKYGRFAFYHQVANPQDVASILQYGLMSTIERFERGLFTSGMSSEYDFGTGGANSVFTRMMVENAYDLGSGSVRLDGINIIFDSKKMFGRSDWLARNYDSYGSTEKFEDRLTPEETITDQIENGYDGRNEQMFNVGIGWRAIKKIVVRNQMQYDEIVNILKKAGLSHYLYLVEKVEDMTVDKMMNLSWGSDQRMGDIEEIEKVRENKRKEEEQKESFLKKFSDNTKQALVVMRASTNALKWGDIYSALTEIEEKGAIEVEDGDLDELTREWLRQQLKQKNLDLSDDGIEKLVSYLFENARKKVVVKAEQEVAIMRDLNNSEISLLNRAKNDSSQMEATRKILNDESISPKKVVELMGQKSVFLIENN